MLTERPRPAMIREHRHAGWLAVATVCFGAFMGQLDASIVTLTFPALQHEFHAPLAAVQWVSLSYLLTLVGLMVAVGRVADAAGRKAVYLYGFAVFTAASAACALVPNLGWLIVARAAQALGAAMLQANSVALVVTSVPRRSMRSALGVQAAAQALGLALGPAIGGLLVASAGWRWVFWVNVPVGIVALVAGRYLLPRTREHSAIGRFDWPGLVLLGVATTALLLALSGVSGLPMPGWAALALLVAAVAAVIGFAVRERRCANPLIDVSLLRGGPVSGSEGGGARRGSPRTVSVGLAGALGAYLVLFGPLTLFPQVFAGASGGLVITALPAGFAVAAVLVNQVMPTRWSTRVRCLIGGAAFVAGSGALLAAPASHAWVAGWLAVMGLGLGVFIPANNTAIMAAIPTRMAATGGGLVNMGRGLGTALGVTAVTLSLHFAGGAAAADAARPALAALAVLALATGLTVLAMPARAAPPPTSRT